MGRTGPETRTGNPVAELRSAADEPAIWAIGRDLMERYLEADVWVFAVAGSDEVVVRGAPASTNDQVDHPFPVPEILIRRPVERGQSVIIDDLAEAPVAAAADPTSAAGSYRSCLLVPIGSVGVGVAFDRSPRGFDEADRGLGEHVASLVAPFLDAETDRTREATAEDRLRDIGNVLGHDFGNPLMVARGWLTEVQEGGDVDALRNVETALDRIEELAKSLEVYARTGRSLDKPNLVSLGEISAMGWSMVQTEDGTLEVAEDGTVFADDSRLQQLFENLFRNAVEHGGSSVTVEVGTLTDESGFYVQDDGEGIPTEERSVILEHGYSNADGKTGFGMSIVAEIADAHGWDMRVTESDAGGTRVEFSGVISDDPSSL